MKNQSTNRLRHTSRPRLEALESRWCPATTVRASGGTVTITGDAQANHILVSDAGNGTVVINVVDGNQPTGREFAFVNISRVVLNTGAGRDGVTHVQSGNRTLSMNLTADLGSDVDVFHSEIKGDILSWRMLEMTVHGGTGGDTIGVHADSDVDVQALSLLKLDLNGGDDKDSVLALYRGEADGELRLNARGGNHDDTVTARLDIDAGSTGRLGALTQRATVEGNAGNDTLAFRVHSKAAPSFRTTATIDGGSNSWWPWSRKDKGTFTPNVSVTGIESQVRVPL